MRVNDPAGKNIRWAWPPPLRCLRSASVPGYSVIRPASSWIVTTAASSRPQRANNHIVSCCKSANLIPRTSRGHSIMRRTISKNTKRAAARLHHRSCPETLAGCAQRTFTGYVKRTLASGFSCKAWVYALHGHLEPIYSAECLPNEGFSTRGQ